ncbi:MAG TPA: N-acetylneuraminate synthase family protein, partial [Thermotogota bacterium]|nr:N-acetylneuraminate synthase family protein [Thermotogota bacterium]
MHFRIGERQIGDHAPVFVIAEMSANHQQDFDLAVKIIKEAKKAGADAIKMQTYTPDSMTIDCDNEYFQLKQLQHSFLYFSEK